MKNISSFLNNTKTEIIFESEFVQFDVFKFSIFVFIENVLQNGEIIPPSFGFYLYCETDDKEKYYFLC
jgi:hypothetical protein